MSIITEVDEYAFKLEQRKIKRSEVLVKYQCDKNVRKILSKFPKKCKLLTHLSYKLNHNIHDSLVARWYLTLNNSNKDVVMINLENCFCCEGFNYEIKFRGLGERGTLFKGVWFIEKTTAPLKDELREAINKIFGEVFGNEAEQKGFHI